MTALSSCILRVLYSQYMQFLSFDIINSSPVISEPSAFSFPVIIHLCPSADYMQALNAAKNVCLDCTKDSGIVKSVGGLCICYGCGNYSCSTASLKHSDAVWPSEPRKSLKCGSCCVCISVLVNS